MARGGVAGFTRRRTGSRPSRPSPRSSGCCPLPRPPFGLPAAGDVAPLHSPRKYGVSKARPLYLPPLVPYAAASVLGLATKATTVRWLPVRYTVILTDEVKARLHALPLALRRE